MHRALLCVFILLCILSLSVHGVSQERVRGHHRSGHKLGQRVSGSRHAKQQAKPKAAQATRFSSAHDSAAVHAKKTTVATRSARGLQRGLAKHPATVAHHQAVHQPVHHQPLGHAAPHHKQSHAPAAGTTLLQQRVALATRTQQTPDSSLTDVSAEQAPITTTSSTITSTDAAKGATTTQTMSTLPAPTDLGAILQAYSDLETRVGRLEEGRADPMDQSANIAAAQRRAAGMIQAAKDSVEAERAQNPISALERSEKVEQKKATVQAHAHAQATKAAVHSLARAHAKLLQKHKQTAKDEPGCCSHDSVARAAQDSNAQSIANLKGEVERLTEAITAATTSTPTPGDNPPPVDEPSFPETRETTGGSPSAATSTGSDAQCNANIDMSKATGDKNIWKEEAEAKQAALAKLMKKIEPQMHPKLVTDQKVLAKAEEMLSDNTEKGNELRKKLTETCSESTCALGANGGILVEPDTK